MKRELVTGLLTLSLLASMLPANAQAAEGMFGASAAGQVQTMTEGAGEDGVQTENAADIDGTQYATLAEAVAQAEEGATIRLLRDVELDASGLVNGQGALTLSKDLTLDGSGHTIRAKAGTFSVSGDNGTGPSLLNLQDGAEVTLRDVTLDGGSAANSGSTQSSASQTGDGQKMMVWAGACMEDACGSKVQHDFDAGPGSMADMPFLAVKNGGSRFCNEAACEMAVMGNFLRSEADQGWYSQIFDSNYMADTEGWPGVALPLLIALIGRVRRLNAQLWTAGAVFGGIGGLVGNVTGDEVWTFAGMGVSAAFAVASRFKAPAGGSDAFGSLR